jgi:hypothetical protein
MTQLSKEFSIKSPKALLWQCGLSHAEVVDRLRRGVITVDWLICPHGEAERSKPIRELPIDDFDAVREVFWPLRNSRPTQPLSIASTATPAPSFTDSQKLDTLERLGRLRELGILTDDEFVREKMRVLNAPVALLEGTPNNGGAPFAIIACGYSFAFLFAPAGLILGIVTLSSGVQDQQRHGITITAISVIIMLLGFLVFAPVL